MLNIPMSQNNTWLYKYQNFLVYNYLSFLLNFNMDQFQEKTSWDETDYQIPLRTTDQSVKYMLTLSGKQFRLLNQQFPQDALQNRPIVCSYADMEFKFPKSILQNVNKDLEDMPVQFAYTKATKLQKKVLVWWIKNRYYQNLNPKFIDLYSGILPLYFGIITQLTKQNDQVLIFSPGYYRFLITLKQTKRTPVEYKLKTRDSQNGPQFYIDNEQLQKVFSSHKIKLVLWISPFNPTGRIWTKQQCQNIVELTKKYDSLIFSDQIYGDSILNVSKFTSMLIFQQIHQNLIWASSFTKTFNCSGSAVAYSYIPNQQIRKKMSWYLDYAYIYPNSYSVKLMKSCYTVGQQWRVNTIKYIRANYQFFKEQCQQKMPKLIIYNLQSAYLMVVDFKNYGISYKEIQELMNSINVYPTYFASCFINTDPNEITTCRISLALNKKVVSQIIHRLSTQINNKYPSKAMKQ